MIGAHAPMGWVQGGEFGPVPREARKLWRFIRILEKEDDSLYRFLDS